VRLRVFKVNDVAVSTLFLSTIYTRPITPQ